MNRALVLFFRLVACGLVATSLAACASMENASQEPLQAYCDKPDTDLVELPQRALLGIGYYAIEKNALQCAERVLLHAQSKDATDPYAPLNLGVVYHRTQRTGQARIAFEQASALDPIDRDGELETIALSTNKGVAIHFLNRPGEVARFNLLQLR